MSDNSRKTETCEMCGEPTEMTMSLQVNGQPRSRAICMKCLRTLPKRVAAMVAEKRRRENAK